MSKLFLRILVLALAATAFTRPIHAQEEEFDQAQYEADQQIQDATSKIATTYSLTKLGILGSDRVTDPGAMYTFRIEGLLSRPFASMLDLITPTSVIKLDGTLVPPGKGFIASFGAVGNVQQINPGDRYYLRTVTGHNDNITFEFISVNTVPIVYKGNSIRARLRMYLKFELPKDSKKKGIFPAPDEFHKRTDLIFYPTDSVDMRPKLEVGQTEEDVRKVLGEPETVVCFGNKTILAFKSIKVILIDGKVTDVN